VVEEYYIRDHQDRISGPFSGSDLKKLAREKKLDLSWQVSADRVQWCPLAKVRNLSADLEKLLAENLSTEGQYRNLSRQEVIALFLDKFILNNENFKDSIPFLQPIRVWWAKLTLPKDFVITEITSAGIHHVKYNVGTGESHEIDQKEAEKNVSEGIKQFNWFLLLSAVLGAVWLVWTLKDFVGNFSLTWGTLKTVLFVSIALAGFILKTKRSKVFVGYKLDPAAMRKLEEIAGALRVLRKCGRVWVYRLSEYEGRFNWKYHAGDTFKVARLPLAIFNRTIPNVETNIRINGISYGSKAIYFLPEKILVIEGSEVTNVPYADLEIAVESLEYVEAEGHVYEDSAVIDHRWKFINRDGSRDRRFNNNVELPVVRCGLLGLVVGRAKLKMMTTNPDAPVVFQEKFKRLASAAVLSEKMSAELDTNRIHDVIPVAYPAPPASTAQTTPTVLPKTQKAVGQSHTVQLHQPVTQRGTPEEVLDAIPVEPARRVPSEPTQGPAYIGKIVFGLRIPTSIIQDARGRFLGDGETLLAIVKGRLKTQAYLIVTDRRVILLEHRFFSSSSESFDFADITGVEQQGRLGSGSVVLNVHGTKTSFTGMHPDEVGIVAGIISQQKQRTKEGHQAAAFRPDNNPAAQLEILAGLLDKGLITRSEFDEKKRKLLGQI
jgi:hypothetical protein